MRLLLTVLVLIANFLWAQKPMEPLEKTLFVFVHGVGCSGSEVQVKSEKLKAFRNMSSLSPSPFIGELLP